MDRVNSTPAFPSQTTSTINFAALGIESQKVLQTGFTASVIWVVVGAVGTVCAALVLANIIKHRRELLQFVHYNNMLHLAIADFVECVAHFVVNLRQIILAITKATDVTPIALCGLKAGFNTFVINACACQTTAMAVSRLLSIVAPVKFRNIDPPKMQLVNGCFWLVSLSLCVAVSFGLVSEPYIAGCKFTLTYQVWATTLPTTFNAVIASLNVSLTILLIIILLWRAKQIKFSAVALKSDVELKASLTGALVGLNCIVVFYTPAIASFAMTNAGASQDERQKMINYTNALYGVNSIGSFLIYLCTDSTFRTRFKLLMKAAKPLQTAQSSSVTPSSTALPECKLQREPTNSF